MGLNLIAGAPETAAHASGYECIVRPVKGSFAFIAEYIDIPTVVGYGVCPTEAIEEADRVLELWLAQAKSLGIEIPEPGTMASVTGAFKIRAPKSLHRDLVLTAYAHNCSLTQLVTRLLTAGISEKFLPEVKGDVGYLCLSLPKLTKSNRQQVPPDKEFSGLWLQRVPRIVHLQLQRLADLENSSMATIVVHLLSLEVGKIQEHFRIVNARKPDSDAA